MARPRLGESERRRRTIGVRVTAAEATELRLGAAELRELNTHLASGSGLIHRGRQGSHPLWFSCLRGVGELAGWNTRRSGGCGLQRHLDA